MKMLRFLPIFIFGVMFVGVVGAYVTSKNTAVLAQTKSNNSKIVDSAFNSKAANLRLQLNTLLREHAALGAITLSSLYKGEDTTRFMQLLNDNQSKIASLLQNAYGSSSANSFSTLWSAHMKDYQDYTLAKKANDITKMSNARKNLQQVASQLGSLLSKAGKNQSANTITSAMTDHINGTLNIVDAVAAGNQSNIANLVKQGYDQAGKFADILAKGILLDKPQKFQ